MSYDAPVGSLVCGLWKKTPDTSFPFAFQSALRFRGPQFNLISGGSETLNPGAGLCSPTADSPSSSTAYHKEGIKPFFREYEVM